ncbi:hypothetical protein N7532_000623 [Penicillium argentinense]|uniref:Zn(2)-C6 fungal-type domain-containing protein n=1 Tax=Penicillium argentinense TaxID=1131581 RepID=A0A9W9G626_9EURO|nr:uncharacterized protein N7532_000623 [Penicillium argentinense]KAJ5112578.1 hypothetical protein N7532_000623 [Penicillium argentinense]
MPAPSGPAATPADKDSAEAPRTPGRRVPKKRTKTGCLTCRKRRIKCDEDKPICGNCIKARRNAPADQECLYLRSLGARVECKPLFKNIDLLILACVGYAQRVIFKNPVGIFGAFGPPQSQGLQMQQQMRVPLYNDYGPLPAQQAAAAAQHPMLAPRPVDMSAIGYPPTATQPSPALPPESASKATAPQFYYPTPPIQSTPQSWPAEQNNHSPQHAAPVDYPPTHSRSRSQPQSQSAQSQSQSEPQPQLQPRSAVPEQSHYQYHSQQDPSTLYSQPMTSWDNFPTSQDYAAQYAAQLARESAEDKSHENPLFPQPIQQPGTMYQYQQQPGKLSPETTTPRPFIPLSQPQVVYVEDESEDFFDVESDDDMIDQTQTEGFNQLSLIMASANHDSQLRSFTSHLNEPNILANYRPSLGSSPLNNPKTARIFAHFIHSTGPSLSIFERHPTDSSIVLGVQVPPAQQGLWTYTLPLKALEHPALLQAILAISSLHIAYLQGVPSTVSLKHYHYALKRIGRAVGLPMRRKQIGTLAATELLAYYEVISADHSKWNSHVAGAAQLIKEIDFAGTTRDLRAYRRGINEQRQMMGWSNPQMHLYGFGSDGTEDDPFAEKEATVDEAFVSSMLGRAIKYDEFGTVEDGHAFTPRKHFTRKDIEHFRIQCDLYWWFTKQDVFHSLISGEKLFTPFYLKGQCPPRAGMGRIDAIYGSADHLWLLLARISDFGYRDRKRKLKALRAAGTEWRPGPGMFKFMGRFAGGGPNRKPGPLGKPPGAPPPGPGHQNFGPGPASGPPPGPPRGGPPSQPAAPEGPPMYGMIPPGPPTHLPSGFVDGRLEHRESSEEGDENSNFSHQETEERYNEAEQDWEEILAALDAYAEALGRDFQPLPADVTPSIPTPFGSALSYRTHTVAVIWGFFYTGRILLHRLHPSMPPAMMMAAGVAAPTTAEYAQFIGRITAGIYYPQRHNLQAGSLSPNLGSSLTEMTMPIFFAAVQYMDPTQRSWTITKLRDVSRLTGWKTSDAIASGCEKAWIVAAKHGRGPPYERSFESPRDRENHPQDVLCRDSGGQQSDDRRFVTVQPTDRAYLAMGLLSLEGDMENLEL